MVGLSGCGILRVPGLRDVGIKGSLFWGFGKGGLGFRFRPLKGDLGIQGLRV